MLDTTRSRAGVSPRLNWTLAIATFVFLVPLAGIRTKAAASTPSLTPVTVVETTANEPVVTAAPTMVVVSRPRQQRDDRFRTTDSTFEKILEAKSGERLVLDLDSGGEVAVFGWDEPKARLRVRLGGQDWRETRVDFSRVDGGIRLMTEFERSRNSRSTDHQFELWVPRNSDVEVRSSGGSLRFDDISGRFRGHTGGGSIDIQRARGRSSLSTGGGDISVTESDLSGTISTGGGSVVLSKVTGGLRGSSGSGPVVYAEPPRREGSSGGGRSEGTGDLSGVTITSGRITTNSARANASATTTHNRTNTTTASGGEIGRLHVSKAGGSITIDDAPEGGTIHTGGGNITIERAAGAMKVTTGGGDIEIRRTTGSATASTGSGDVRITVVDEDGGEHDVEVFTGHGTIELTLPATLDARLDLEAAYTDGFGRRSRIESEWNVEKSETSEWESPNGGTPRKYVRAKGSFGNGRGLIRVQAVNGDVIVKRAAR